MRTWLLLASLALSGAPPPSDPPADCGQDQPELPSFSLEDVNPTSATYGQSLGLDDFTGQARVVYWASATCGVCKSHVQALEAITTQQGWTDVQVLVPMHKGIAGTENLNRSLQAHFTAGQREWVVGGKNTPRRIFRRTDRVMQTRNDYEKAVFNGDIGEVIAVDAEAATLTVDFDGKKVKYEGREVSALQLAYALSIHKSQGSEFDAVIVCLLPEHHVMLRRNLLYTAITRAKKLCVIVGDPRAIERAIGQASDNMRHTGLAGRLADALRLGGLGLVPELRAGDDADSQPESEFTLHVVPDPDEGPDT